MMRMCHFRAQNGPFVQKKKILSTNHCYYFHIPIGPFHCAKFKKILHVDPDLWGCAIFGPKMAHFPKWRFFGEELRHVMLSYVVYIFLKRRLWEFSSLSEFKIVSTKHKKHWIDLAKMVLFFNSSVLSNNLLNVGVSFE